LGQQEDISAVTGYTMDKLAAAGQLQVEYVLKPEELEKPFPAELNRFNENGGLGTLLFRINDDFVLPPGWNGDLATVQSKLGVEIPVDMGYLKSFFNTERNPDPVKPTIAEFIKYLDFLHQPFTKSEDVDISESV
jgi:hypothetical protein